MFNAFRPLCTMMIEYGAMCQRVNTILALYDSCVKIYFTMCTHHWLYGCSENAQFSQNRHQETNRIWWYIFTQENVAFKMTATFTGLNVLKEYRTVVWLFVSLIVAFELHSFERHTVIHTTMQPNYSAHKMCYKNPKKYSGFKWN